MSSRHRPRNLAVTFSVVVAVGGAGVAWRAMRDTRLADAAMATARREQTRTEAAAREIEEKAAASAGLRAKLEGELARLRAASPVPPTPKSGAPAKPPAPSFANSPEQQAMALKRFKAGLLFENLAFYRAAGLGEKQMARLEEILTEHQGRGRDLQLTASERRLASSDPAIAALRREETERFEGELQELLGEEGRRRFAEFQAGATERRAVAEIAGNLALTPTPLTPAQGQQIVALLKEVRFRERRADGTMWDDLLLRSRSFLSAPQVAELQAMSFAGGERVFNELQQLADRAKK